MALFQLDKVALKGIAASVPSNKIANVNFAYHSELENQQFIKTTGIEFRRVLNKGLCASDLCLRAAEDLLNELQWSREEINILVFISQTPDYKIPNTASVLQSKLGLSKACIAFDINLGCSGYVYGLSIIGSLLEKVKGKALLLVGDASSQCVNPLDKSSAPLFSDAGSASALEFDSKAESIIFNLQTDGSGFDAIITPDGGARNPINKNSFLVDNATGRSRADMFLDGIKVFNFSRREVVPNALELISEFKINKESIDYFVFHQANKLMNDTLVKKLNLDNDRVPTSLRNYGNTGSASIPLTITLTLVGEKAKGTKRLLLSGFGVGLSWGSCILSTENCTILPLIEI